VRRKLLEHRRARGRTVQRPSRARLRHWHSPTSGCSAAIQQLNLLLLVLLQVQCKKYGTRPGQSRGLQQLRESMHHIRSLRLQQRRKRLRLRQRGGCWVLLLLLAPAAACGRCGDGGLTAETTERDARCIARKPCA
jgi:hypothetical protein